MNTSFSLLLTGWVSLGTFSFFPGPVSAQTMHMPCVCECQCSNQTAIRINATAFLPTNICHLSVTHLRGFLFDPYAVRELRLKHGSVKAMDSILYVLLTSLTNRFYCNLNLCVHEHLFGIGMFGTVLFVYNTDRVWIQNGCNFVCEVIPRFDFH